MFVLRWSSNTKPVNESVNSGEYEHMLKLATGFYWQHKRITEVVREGTPRKSRKSGKYLINNERETRVMTYEKALTYAVEMWQNKRIITTIEAFA